MSLTSFTNSISIDVKIEQRTLFVIPYKDKIIRCVPSYLIRAYQKYSVECWLHQPNQTVVLYSHHQPQWNLLRFYYHFDNFSVGYQEQSHNSVVLRYTYIRTKMVDEQGMSRKANRYTKDTLFCSSIINSFNVKFVLQKSINIVNRIDKSNKWCPSSIVSLFIFVPIGVFQLCNPMI